MLLEGMKVVEVMTKLVDIFVVFPYERSSRSGRCSNAKSFSGPWIKSLLERFFRFLLKSGRISIYTRIWISSCVAHILDVLLQKKL